MQRDFSENRIILICRYLTATAGKSDVKKRKRESCHILTKSPEIQALQGEEISKACEKLQRREELPKILNKNKVNVKVKFLGRKDSASLFYYNGQTEIYFVNMKNIILKMTKA